MLYIAWVYMLAWASDSQVAWTGNNILICQTVHALHAYNFINHKHLMATAEKNSGLKTFSTYFLNRISFLNH